VAHARAECATYGARIEEIGDLQQRHPLASALEQARVLRGASWFGGFPDTLLSSNRNYYVPDYRDDDIGFRCVLVGV